MNTSDFDYLLPPERIAQEPVKPRDQSRLMVVDRTTGTCQDRRFFEIGDFLKPGDLLVVNDSKVFKARLHGHVGVDPRVDPGPGEGERVGSPLRGNVEIFLLRPDGGRWIALAKPGRKLTVGTVVTFGDSSAATVVGKRDDGTIVLDFGRTAEDVLTWTDLVGTVPTPPYVERPPADADSVYQTVYATSVGSVAAPTAGFHFTPELIMDLKMKGIRFATVTLHVGLGTFRPIKTETIKEHVMHEEWVDVPDETVRLIEQTKATGGRVIAVGTTSVRALESTAQRNLPAPLLRKEGTPVYSPPSQGGVRGGSGHGGFSGFTDMFITPGYRFTTVDALITNFHLPKSTLLVLVSAFIGEKHDDPDEGRRIALDAYADAIAKGYRFYSFGDAMFIF